MATSKAYKDFMEDWNKVRTQQFHCENFTTRKMAYDYCVFLGKRHGVVKTSVTVHGEKFQATIIHTHMERDYLSGVADGMRIGVEK